MLHNFTPSVNAVCVRGVRVCKNGDRREQGEAVTVRPTVRIFHCTDRDNFYVFISLIYFKCSFLGRCVKDKLSFLCSVQSRIIKIYLI